MDHQQVLQRGPVTSSRAHATQRQAEEKTVRLGRREGERVVREEMRGEGNGGKEARREGRRRSGNKKERGITERVKNMERDCVCHIR